LPLRSIAFAPCPSSPAMILETERMDTELFVMFVEKINRVPRQHSRGDPLYGLESTLKRLSMRPAERHQPPRVAGHQSAKPVFVPCLQF
jgi:hypothetical protein